jgi:peptidyl-dipeptidase A
MVFNMFKINSLIYLIITLGIASTVIGCSAMSKKNSPSPEQTREFIEKYEQYVAKSEDSRQYAWYSWHRFLNIDAQNHFSQMMGLYRKKITNNVYQSAEFIGAELDEDMTLRFNRIRSRLNNPAPTDEKNSARLSELTQSLHTRHSKPCESSLTAESCLSLSDANAVMANSTDAEKLQQVWQDNRNTLIPMRIEFAEKVALNNLGTQRVGFENMAEMRSSRFYQMPAEEFTLQLDRVWKQISPLYASLQCHVKAKLGDKYGTDIVKQDKPIPAHLIGSLTGSSLANLYNDVMPTEVTVDRGYNLTEKLVSAGYTEADLLRSADKYNASMGFALLDESFYTESTFTKPEGYNVECDSGLWWLRETNQSRLVACYNVTGKDFLTSYGEVAQHLYWKGSGNQPRKYNDFPTGFLHAVVKAQKLFMSPTYLKQIELSDGVLAESSDLGFLMKLALDEVSKIPFKILVDKWRWAVASGDITPKDYNSYWWQLRKEYQGITPSTLNNSNYDDKNYFDAGAVAAVINNRELSISAVQSILAFQIHKNVCDASGNTDLLSHCSTYNSEEAGNKLKALYNMGNSKPWSETLITWANEKQLDGSALVEYFEPLQSYLDEQNKDRNCGW